ncbi:MAG: Ig-like domain-containing protein [Gemmatimonadaceae bacterium]
MNRTLSSGAALALAIGIVSCSENSLTGTESFTSDDLSADASRVATVSVSIAAASIEVGDTTRATATLRDYRDRIILRTVTWSSSDPAVAAIDTTGLVTALAEGTAVITASRGFKSGSATITVAPATPAGDGAPVASVRVSLGASSLSPGQATQATAATYDSSGNILTGRSISWSSSDAGVATISGSGIVTAVAPGTSQITATSEGKSGSTAISVTAPPPQSTNPGTVTDLKVIAVDSNGVTLSFTQVDDGTGQPAKYDVRYAPTPISWGSAASVTNGSCAVPLGGTAIGSSLVCKILGLTPSTTYDFQLVAFRGTLNFNATFGTLSNVATGTTTASGPPPPPPTGSHEPAGMTLISDQPFNSLPSNGWTGFCCAMPLDPTAPRSPQKTIQFDYPAGFVSGSSPSQTDLPLSGNLRTLYVDMWIKFSPNWQGERTTMNKIYHLLPGNTNHVVIWANGVGSDPLYAGIYLQGIAAGGNAGGATGVYTSPIELVRGQWYRMEVVATANTGSNRDGSVTLWVNGVLAATATGIEFEAGGPPWTYLQLSPTWGGGGDRVTNAMWMRIDHMYVSGK